MSVIEFSTIEKSDYYDGKFVNSGPFTLSFSNDEPKDDQITLSVYSDDDTFNYSVVSLTELELELIYLPRGNTLKYVRKDEANE